MPPATGESMDTVGTGNLIVKIAVALVVFPLASVATATNVYWPSSNGILCLYVKLSLTTCASSAIFASTTLTSSPSSVRLSLTGFSGVAKPENSPLISGWLISYICPAAGT